MYQTWTYSFEALLFLISLNNQPCTVLLYYMLAICIILQELRFYNVWLLPYSHLRDCHCHRWVHYIVTTKIWYFGLFCFVWFLIIYVWYCILIYAALFHSEEHQLHFHRGWHHHEWVFYFVLQKYDFKVCVISFDFYSTHYKVFIYFLHQYIATNNSTIRQHSRLII